MNDSHFDRRKARGYSKFLAEIFTRLTAEGPAQIVIERCILNVDGGHWQAWHAGESLVREAGQRRPIARGELLEHDQRRPLLAGMRFDRRSQGFHAYFAGLGVR